MTIILRDDQDAASMRALALQTRRIEVRQRMLGIAAIYAGASRATAAEIAGVGRQVLRDWVIRFNAEGPSSLCDSDRKGGGGQVLSIEHKTILKEILDRGRRTAGGARKASLEEMLAEFQRQTGRRLSVRCLSQHIAKASQFNTRETITSRPSAVQANFKRSKPSSSNARMDEDPLA